MDPSHGEHPYDADNGLYDYGEFDDCHNDYRRPAEYKGSCRCEGYGGKPHGYDIRIKSGLSVPAGPEYGYHAHHLKKGKI